MPTTVLGPRDGDYGEFASLGITFSFDDRDRVIVTYPETLAFRKRKGAGRNRDPLRHCKRLDLAEPND